MPFKHSCYEQSPKPQMVMKPVWFVYKQSLYPKSAISVISHDLSKILGISKPSINLPRPLFKTILHEGGIADGNRSWSTPASISDLPACPPSVSGILLRFLAWASLIRIRMASELIFCLGRRNSLTKNSV
jgi:hypothetical protein